MTAFANKQDHCSPDAAHDRGTGDPGVSGKLPMDTDSPRVDEKGLRVIDERDLEMLACPDPAEAAQLCALGRAALERGDVLTAGDYLDRALALDPANAGAHAALSALYQRKGPEHAVFDALYRATALDPERLEYQQELLLALEASFAAC